MSLKGTQYYQFAFVQLRVVVSLVFIAAFTVMGVVGCKQTAQHKEQQGYQTKEKYKGEKPNIVFLLADDMGYGELGSYGQADIKTPFLDSLASKGMRFTDFYAGTSVCSPSRASLMTGLHTGHLSIRGNQGNINSKWDRIPLRKSEKTLGEMLQNTGYQTAMIGKWHLGIPEDVFTWAKGRGFDYAVQEQWGKNKNGREIDERIHWVNNNQD
ncbi:MAG: sulfatase-like hydrolase/transferase, partial [Allomuricauda sp.]